LIFIRYKPAGLARGIVASGGHADASAQVGVAIDVVAGCQAVAVEHEFIALDKGVAGIEGLLDALASPAEPVQDVAWDLRNSQLEGGEGHRDATASGFGWGVRRVDEGFGLDGIGHGHSPEK
jgi:hypothetical protein